MKKEKERTVQFVAEKQILIQSAGISRLSFTLSGLVPLRKQNKTKANMSK